MRAGGELVVLAVDDLDCSPAYALAAALLDDDREEEEEGLDVTTAVLYNVDR